jgi:hypothetical protein
MRSIGDRRSPAAMATFCRTLAAGSSRRGSSQIGRRKNGVRKMKAGATASANYLSDPHFSDYFNLSEI